jgi:osmotically inducible protein OsmC
MADSTKYCTSPKAPPKAPPAAAMAARTSSYRLRARRVPGSTPEQLFAAMWSACLLGAVKIVAAKRRVMLPAGTASDAEVDLCIADGAYVLRAVSTSACRIWRTKRRRHSRTRHQTCPYSKAIRGNIDVAINVINSN